MASACPTCPPLALTSMQSLETILRKDRETKKEKQNASNYIKVTETGINYI